MIKVANTEWNLPGVRLGSKGLLCTNSLNPHKEIGNVVIPILWMRQPEPKDTE